MYSENMLNGLISTENNHNISQFVGTVLKKKEEEEQYFLGIIQEDWQ